MKLLAPRRSSDRRHLLLSPSSSHPRYTYTWRIEALCAGASGANASDACDARGRADDGADDGAGGGAHGRDGLPFFNGTGDSIELVFRRAGAQYALSVVVATKSGGRRVGALGGVALACKVWQSLSYYDDDDDDN